MTKKMLIDGAHSEQVRLAITNHGLLDEYDHEITAKASLKGNIYLARITRVEPSLQAAFIDYGQERQGFLSFSEIHPDYYRIPVADKEKFLAAPLEDEDDGHDAEDDDNNNNADSGESNNALKDQESNAEQEGDEEDDASHHKAKHDDDDDDERAQALAVKKRRINYARLRRHYRIQEVIKTGQVLLVQVVKDERGQKGAAVTTFLSIAGRYCVLMPNTIRAGGVSRKISNTKDRKRLKNLINSFNIQPNMGIILRTAGAERASVEIKRDFSYLTKLWDKIREQTLTSHAPCIINEEASLAKRAIRDYYDRDMDEIWVEGDECYQQVRDTLKEMIPSHSKKLQKYEGANKESIFTHFNVESYIQSIHKQQVPMKSGGFLVINQTEALVAIDVNSGRSIKERNIEETAVKTNLEATEEICKQLRLRDLSGLIVIDYIDMEERQNVYAVENYMRECLKYDRARIQTSRISMFGLMEMSRQRLRPSIFESTNQKCDQCHGLGFIEHIHHQSLNIIRDIETHIALGKTQHRYDIVVTVQLTAKLLEYFLSSLHDKIVMLQHDDVSLTFKLIDPSHNTNYRIDITQSNGRPIHLKPKNDRYKQRHNKASHTRDDTDGRLDGGHNDDEQKSLPKKRKQSRNRRDKASVQHSKQRDDDATSMVQDDGDSPSVELDVTNDMPVTAKKSRPKNNRSKQSNANKKQRDMVEIDSVDDTIIAETVSAAIDTSSHDPAVEELAVKAIKMSSKKTSSKKTSSKKIASKQAASKKEEVKDDASNKVDSQEVTSKKTSSKKVSAKKTSTKKSAAKKNESKQMMLDDAPSQNSASNDESNKPTKKESSKTGWWQRVLK